MTERKPGRPKGSTDAVVEKKRLEDVQVICERVAEGHTLREIAEHLGVTAGMILHKIEKDPESIRQYTRARDIASDIFESKAIDAAINARQENAAADRILVDTLKWAAGNRSPKKYGSKVQTDVTSSDGSLIPTKIVICAAEKLSQDESSDD